MPWKAFFHKSIATLALVAVLAGASLIPASAEAKTGFVLPEELRAQILEKVDHCMVFLGSLHQPTVKFFAHNVFEYPTSDWPRGLLTRFRFPDDHSDRRDR